MMGVLKENTDVEGVQIFQNKYFPFPLYVDKERQFYKELGNRKIYTQQWNIFKMLKSYSGVRNRLQTKGNIEGNLKGEGLVQGGVLLVSRAKGVVFQYAEKTGSEVPVDDIESIVNDLSQ
jgi:hypothetical protein